MPNPKNRDDGIPPPHVPTAATEVARFEHSATAAVAVGAQSQAHGTLNMHGLTVNAQMVLFSAATAPAPSPASAISLGPRGHLTSSRSTPTPAYPDAETRALSEKLTDAQARKLRLQQCGADVSAVTSEIIGLKRQLREGGQLKPGDLLGDGRYLLLHAIGQGGFATVWKAHDTLRDEDVAIKVLHPNLAGDALRLDRFRRGARIMQAFEHSAVVRVLDAQGDDGGWHYFVMEYVAGGDLRRAVIERRLRADGVVPLILNVGAALAAAHSRGIVHRDVKPANVILDAFGAPKLSDFDLVGAADTTGGTRTGAMGSFLYAAPECMHRPQEGDARADVYGLGMTAIFCLYQQELPLFVVRSPEGILDGLPCSAAVKKVLGRATEWDARERPADAAAFCYALSEAFKGTNLPDVEYGEHTGEFGGAVSGSLPPRHFPDYSQPASPVRLSKNSRAGLSPKALVPVLTWLEETWTLDEGLICSELREDARGFDDWIAALAQAWSLARRLRLQPSRAGSHANLKYLGLLVEAQWCMHRSLTIQLWTAWLWARGRSADTTRWILDSERQVTGCTGQVLTNILATAEPVRHAFEPAYPELWGIRFG